MEVERLKRLAGHLRAVLEDDGATVSHGRALDLIAAVPGLRNWPEVMAFPDRVASCDLDLAACERLALRCTHRHGSKWLGGLWLHLLGMAEFHATRPVRDGTERLIVTTGDSGAGHLKMSRIADRVVAVHDRLVSGPVPAADDPPAFFVAREAAADADPRDRNDLFEWDRAAAATADWEALLAVCRAYDRVELWIDPTPNEQLSFIRLLDGLGRQADIADRLFVVHADDPLGGRSAPSIATMEPTIVPVGVATIEAARRAWAAYRQPTPEAWFGLLDDDLAALPWLRRTVLLLLGELPAHDTALGATERLLLDVVAPGAVRPSRFFAVDTRDNPGRVYDYFDEIRLVNRLGSGARPAIDGVHDPAFSLATMNDTDRRTRYLRSELSLTKLGRALRDGRDDWSRHDVVHRWWGGTLLTNDRLWRWNADALRLVAPA